MVKSTREFPKDWKIELIKPVYKGNGNQREPRKYRRISLLHVLGKISVFRSNS
jgi:hypothetical protein